MPVRIDYKASVEKDLRKIGMPHSTRVMNKLEKILSQDPNKGEPLKGKYKGMFKLRVGEYRVIYSKTKIGVLVLRIRHRGKAYR